MLFSVQTGIMKYQDIIRAAQKAKQRAFTPYSRFEVGAALKTKGGKIYAGCNIEISAYSLTLCAERTAIFKAFSEGEREFVALAVVTDDRGYCPPCGSCRQVLMDLAGNIDIVMVNDKGNYEVMKLLDLLPHPFGPDYLKRISKKDRR